MAPKKRSESSSRTSKSRSRSSRSQSSPSSRSSERSSGSSRSQRSSAPARSQQSSSGARAKKATGGGGRSGRSSGSSRTRGASAKSGSGPEEGRSLRVSSTTKVTTDHEVIRRWAEERGGRPATVTQTASGDEPGILRIDFPDGAEPNLEPISWDEFFRKFDEKNLAFVYQEKTADGKLSRFNKFVARDSVLNQSRKRSGGKTRAAGGQSVFEG